VPATSLAWGVWHALNEYDQANKPDAAATGARLRRQGLPLMTPERAIAELWRALAAGDGTLAVAEMQWERFLPVFTSVRPSPLFELLADQGPQDGPGPATGHAEAAPEAAPLAGRLAGLPDGERRQALLEFVTAQAESVLGRDGTDGLRPGQSFHDLGFDSLTAVELRNRLATAVGRRLPATLVFDHPTPQALAEHLHTELVPAAAPPASVGAELDRLETALAALATADDQPMISARLRALLARWRPDGGDGSAGTGDGVDEGLRSASDDELIAFIDDELGRP
jgi:acyl carrier protein